MDQGNINHIEKWKQYTKTAKRSEPTYIDAVIFSYLHSILSMPKIVDGDFPEEERKQAATLGKLVRKHENLVKYAKKIFENWLK